MKAGNPDAFITDRMIYSMFMKYGKLLMRRQDSQNKLMRFNPLFRTIDFSELIEVDKVQAQCAGLKSDCFIKRTRDRLPSMLDGYSGPLIRTVSSVDGDIRVYQTYPQSYLNMTRQKNFKYNNKQYFWYLDGHLYFPDLSWEAVKVEAAFEFDPAECEDCTPRQKQLCIIPDYLHGDIEQMVSQDLAITLQIPIDPVQDNLNPLR